jgi:hypothetical protein
MHGKWSKLDILNINFRSRGEILPFKAGSYLGTKKVFNVGVLQCPDATRSLCE